MTCVILSEARLVRRVEGYMQLGVQPQPRPVLQYSPYPYLDVFQNPGKGTSNLPLFDAFQPICYINKVPRDRVFFMVQAAF